MIALTITSNPQYGSELSQLDHNGQPVPRDRRTQFIVQVPVHCVSADKEIAISFYVRGRVPMPTAEKVSDSLARTFSVAASVAKSAFAFLPKLHEWTLYDFTEISAATPFEEVSISTPSISAGVQIFPELADALRTETMVRREVKNAFEHAKEFVLRNMKYSGSANEVRQAAQFIEACREREVWSYGDYMDDDRYKKLMPYVEHLLRLKNPAHPNVRASEQVASLLYSAHCPEFWRSPPPRPSQFGLR